MLDWLEDYFFALRHNKAHHLGLGDIRLTIGQQEEILENMSESDESYPGIAADYAEAIYVLDQCRRVMARYAPATDRFAALVDVTARAAIAKAKG